MDHLLISIIVPIYKVEKYLSRCIESLINQDYPSLEIILVDDGSPDKCGEICNDYALRDNRIRVIHQKNGGLSAARNAGIELASGDYYMFVDSDDWVENNYCSYALEKAVSTDSDIVVFGYKDVYDDRIILKSKNVERRLTPLEALRELHGGLILSFAWNKIYKAHLFESGIRYPVGRLFEDIGTTYKLIDVANAVLLTSGITYNYQKREDSILGKKLKAKDAIDWYDLEMERLNYLKQKYPILCDSLWNYYAERVLFLSNVLSRFPGYEEKGKEMESFLLENKDRIRNSGYHKFEINLLYLSPILFRQFRLLKNSIRSIN